jgi:hypothetical protein
MAGEERIINQLHTNPHFKREHVSLQTLPKTSRMAQKSYNPGLLVRI